MRCFKTLSSPKTTTILILALSTCFLTFSSCATPIGRLVTGPNRAEQDEINKKVERDSAAEMLKFTSAAEENRRTNPAYFGVISDDILLIECQTEGKTTLCNSK